MGRNILRRKILSIKGIKPFFGSPRRPIRLYFLFLVFFLICFSNEKRLVAAETEENREAGGTAFQEAGIAATMNKIEEKEPPLYSRPQRSRQDPEESILKDSLYTQSSSMVSGVFSSYIDNPLVQHYILQYSSPGGLSWLTAVMNRGSPYLAFIRREIAERKLPRELLYLPVVESGFLSTAVSKSGAVGLWQFMKNSIGPFNMKVNDWTDDRIDFWKSTQGALSKLDENFKYFNDWPLALAAYNAGLGGINSVIKQSGIRDYWLLSEKKLLKTETIHYVPKLLAVSWILSNPRAFGMEPLWPEDPQWKRVATERSIDLRLLADEAGIDSAELQRANRELHYNVTPPGDNHHIKIPAKYLEKVTAVLARKDLPLLRYYVHTIRSGDTLLALAMHYGVKVDQILLSNPGVQERYLKIGSRLLIPALKEALPYERPSRENLTFNGSHLVKKGETLWSIALGYEVDPELLAEANGMELTDILREGKTLKTPIK